jgi:hypothetical protein
MVSQVDAAAYHLTAGGDPERAVDEHVLACGYRSASYPFAASTRAPFRRRLEISVNTCARSGFLAMILLLPLRRSSECG